MGKIKAILFAGAMLILLTSCSGGNSEEVQKLIAQVDSLTVQINELNSEKENLSAEIQAINSEVQSLKKENEALKIEKAQRETAEKEALLAQTVQIDDVVVAVTSIEKIPKNTDKWIFSNSVKFVFDVKNNTDKEIQGIQGVLDIKDLFNISILKLKCDFTGESIPPGGNIIVDDLSIEINQFMDDHVKVYTTDYKDMKFEYETMQIVFTDGTTKEK